MLNTPIKEQTSEFCVVRQKNLLVIWIKKKIRI